MVNTTINFLVILRNLLENALKFTSKRVIQKIAEATNLIGNKIAAKIRKVVRTSPHKSSQIVTNEIENIGLIPKETYISPEKR